ncbi:MAG: hypothetical protein KA053_11750 [Lentimicrobiaceae bacterium]|nr:hypothetical protein [Lentimicrobiaceae bacterium]
MDEQKTNQECCPAFDPAPWEDKIIEWERKRFLKGKVFTFMYMPVNFGGVIRKMMKTIMGAKAEMPDNLGLSDHTSAWNMDLYLAVDREVHGYPNVFLSGKYYSRVYEGPFKDTSKWLADIKSHTKSKGINIGKPYMWYTTCPKCAKKYGKNYVVILAEIK